MAQVINPPENVGEMPPLSMHQLGALRQSLEQAIALVLAKKGTRIELAVFDGLKPVDMWVQDAKAPNG